MRTTSELSMNDIAIRVEGLGKSHRLKKRFGGDAGYRTLREEVGLMPKRLLAVLNSAQAIDEFWALRDVSFELKRGEVLGIVGRNGAGKSTLLKVLSRITEPSEGYVDIYGRVGSLLEVGTGFHPELTGRENIYLSGAILGMRRPEISERFDEIVAFANVERFVDEAVKHYSSGMYARLAFAVAAHLETEILMMDEVLAVGDAEFQKKCLDKMREVSRCGRSVVFVSHDLGAIRKLTDRCLWLDAGRLKQVGPREEVLAAYRDALTLSGKGAGMVDFEDGFGKIGFTRASLWSESGVGCVGMGQSLRLVFELRAHPEFTHLPVALAVGLRSEEGIPIALMAEVDSGVERIASIGGHRRIEVCIDDVKLYPGVYWLRLWVGDPTALETYDDRTDALCFTVMDAPSLSRRRLLPGQGFIFFQPSWRFKDVAEPWPMDGK